MIVLYFVVYACMMNNREFTTKGDIPTKPVKGNKAKRKMLTTFADCGGNLKIKYLVTWPEHCGV